MKQHLATDVHVNNKTLVQQREHDTHKHTSVSFQEISLGFKPLFHTSHLIPVKSIFSKFGFNSYPPCATYMHVSVNRISIGLDNGSSPIRRWAII